MSHLYPYQDKTLSPKERARDLVARMTVEECAGQTIFGAAAVERLGLKSYNWWNEALHGVARAGTATVFPQAIGMAATFDPQMIGQAAEIIATEARAKYNACQACGDYGIYKGLTFWSPNVNIFRDPRWGRGQETFGEDPTLTALLGTAFVRGLQGDGPVMKAAACAKHFAVHSGPEPLRHKFDAQATPRDMAETYLPAFKALCDAGVEGFMGAYNRLNGEPCCGSRRLIQTLLRDDWGFDGYFTSDCWAIADFHQYHGITATAIDSLALALNAGCDLNCGQTYELMLTALTEGVINEETLRESVVRLMTTRIRLGMLDESTPYDDIPYEVVDCDEHRRYNREVARRSLVLLKNDGLLPLRPEGIKRVAVIGPNAAALTPLLGNYHGTCNQAHTVLEAVRDALPDARVFYAHGCSLVAPHLHEPGYTGDGLSEVKAQCALADVVILVTGLDETIEGEEGANRDSDGDRPDLYLPEPQRLLAKTVLACGKPVVLVNFTGSAVDFAEADAANAIIQGWYPGAMGGAAVADLLFGAFSPSGRLPVTFYRQSNTLPDFTHYAMEGRTYKYLREEPLYPFGFGLGYSTFAFSELSVASADFRAGDELVCSVQVTNTGSVAAEEVVQFYLRDDEAGVRVPRHKLCGVSRVSLPPGARAQMTMTIPADAFCVVDDDGSSRWECGTFTVFAGGCQPEPHSERLYGSTCAAAQVVMK